MSFKTSPGALHLIKEKQWSYKNIINPYYYNGLSLKNKYLKNLLINLFSIIGIYIYNYYYYFKNFSIFLFIQNFKVKKKKVSKKKSFKKFRIKNILKNIWKVCQKRKIKKRKIKKIKLKPFNFLKSKSTKLNLTNLDFKLFKLKKILGFYFKENFFVKYLNPNLRKSYFFLNFKKKINYFFFKKNNLGNLFYNYFLSLYYKKSFIFTNVLNDFFLKTNKITFIFSSLRKLVLNDYFETLNIKGLKIKILGKKFGKKRKKCLILKKGLTKVTSFNSKISYNLKTTYNKVGSFGIHFYIHH